MLERFFESYEVIEKLLTVSQIRDGTEDDPTFFQEHLRKVKAKHTMPCQLLIDLLSFFNASLFLADNRENGKKFRRVGTLLQTHQRSYHWLNIYCCCFHGLSKGGSKNSKKASVSAESATPGRSNMQTTSSHPHF